MGSQSEALVLRAQNLVQAATGSAVAAHIALSERFEALVDVHPETWELFMTVASFHAATIFLAQQHLHDDTAASVENVLCSRLLEFYPDALPVFADCAGFLERTAGLSASYTEGQKHLALLDALGMWVAANVYDKAASDLSDDEVASVRAIGAAAVEPFRAWWE